MLDYLSSKLPFACGAVAGLYFGDGLNHYLEILGNSSEAVHYGIDALSAFGWATICSSVKNSINTLKEVRGLTERLG